MDRLFYLCCIKYVRIRPFCLYWCHFRYSELSGLYSGTIVPNYWYSWHERFMITSIHGHFMTCSVMYDIIIMVITEWNILAVCMCVWCTHSLLGKSVQPLNKLGFIWLLAQNVMDMFHWLLVCQVNYWIRWLKFSFNYRNKDHFVFIRSTSIAK